jgi:hypothetical protein
LSFGEGFLAITNASLGISQFLRERLQNGDVLIGSRLSQTKTRPNRATPILVPRCSTQSCPTIKKTPGRPNRQRLIRRKHSARRRKRTNRPPVSPRRRPFCFLSAGMSNWSRIDHPTCADIHRSHGTIKVGEKAAFCFFSPASGTPREHS